MKKSVKCLVLMCIAIMLITSVITGCGAKEVKPTAIVIATGGVTGTYYPIGGAIGNVISTKVPNVTATAESTGGSVANIRMINNGEVMLGIAGATSSYQLYNGLPPYDKEPAKNIRAIGALYPETYQVVVRKDSGMKIIDDLKGKKVGVGAAGSGTEAIGKQIMAAHGITYNDIKPEYLSFGECVTALKDKNIDAGIIFAGVPTSSVIEVSTSMDINILDLSPALLNDQAKLDKFMKDNPYFTIVNIPAGTYAPVKDEVKTLATPSLLITRADADEKMIYNITKAMYENLAEIQKAHVQGKSIKLETALQGVSIPLHPGAENYFKEKGLIK